MKRKRLSAGDHVFNFFNYTFFTLFTLICFLPFYYLFINTISNNDLVAKGQIIWYPRGIHFDNYLQVLQIPSFGTAAFVTICRTVLGHF